MAKKKVTAKKGSRKIDGGIPSPYFVMGRNSVSAAVQFSCERLKRIFLVENFAKRDDLGKSLLRIANQKRLPLELFSREELSEQFGSDSHQSCALELSPPKAWSVSELLAEVSLAPTSLIVLVDGVQDPQNFGTLLRVAECFSADAVVWSTNRCAPLSPVATKASVGASELLRLCPISNLANGMRELREAGYWTIGATLGEGSQSLRDFRFPEKSALVLGAEGKGISALTANLCDFHVTIPLSGKLQSLNVSQAAAILAYACRSQFVDLNR